MKEVTLGRIIASIAAVVFLVCLANVAMAQEPPQTGENIQQVQEVYLGEAYDVEAMNAELAEGPCNVDTTGLVEKYTYDPVEPNWPPETDEPPIYKPAEPQPTKPPFFKGWDIKDILPPPYKIVPVPPPAPSSIPTDDEVNRRLLEERYKHHKAVMDYWERKYKELKDRIWGD